ncbi:7-carboxy-7-deazaguanine synthase [Sphingomonas jatrophae]|uniref:7-carboxy-7-deazaguanine synthase n=1 Tax=Sphingomonas jatrophae TaxID=1166337 RepID=A0A1I6JY51_9SPHN|nr:7-carboxy-7-deazaguanine synthase [Sphingomonas jatrophae]SFR83897.1 7-carboxy-7-deazaguanine synthase, Cx14CxxC type [Sphingomonas jatrophae]
MAGYAVKEMFLTLQGEGLQAGRRAVFIRFAGCNLWSGREQDRAGADCTFCDTDFVGTDGDGGGRYADGGALADAALGLWGEWLEEPGAPPFAVLTGGEPTLQVDEALIAALKARGFELAIETNGTRPVPDGIDWICVSPKAGNEVVQRSGDELKLVWPQPGVDFKAMEAWDFTHLLIQPMDGNSAVDTRNSAIKFVLTHPRWRLSVQTHKLVGLR